MPTIFFKYGLRFYFVSFDCCEPPHVHISDDSKKVCKFWLRENRVILADNFGFNKKELTKLQKEVEHNFPFIISKFNEFCKGYKK